MVRKIIIAIATATLAAAVSLTASAQEYAGRLNVTQNVFALQGDSVTVEMEIAVGGAAVPPNSFVLLMPVIKSGSVSMSLPGILINGRERQKVYERQLVLKKGPVNVQTVIGVGDRLAIRTHSYKVWVRYEPWMAGAEFRLLEDHCECSGPRVQMTVQTLAVHLEDRNKPAEPPKPKEPYVPQFATTFVAPAAEPVKIRSEIGHAYLDFPSGVSLIQPDFKNNAAELRRIHELIEGVKNEPHTTITGIAIIGYASPEGTYAANLTLSAKRAEALKEHIKSVYGFSEAIFSVTGHGEDWEMLDTLVAASSMPQKEAILNIIRGTGIFDGRERNLMMLAAGNPYRQMKQELFPKLRRSDYELKYTVSPLTVDEGKELLKTRPSALSLNEMFLIAQTYEQGSRPFNELFETAARVFPQSDVANLNAAATALNRKDAQSAAYYLDKVKEQGAAWYNNMGMLKYLDGQHALAQEYFGKAAAMECGEAKRNLGEVEKAQN